MLRHILLKMWCQGLVWPLLLGFLYTGQRLLVAGCTEDMLKGRPDDPCCKKCPAGYHKAQGDCDGTIGMVRCERCANGQYTTMANTREKCEACTACPEGQKTLKACSYTMDTKCACDEGYYQLHGHQDMECRSCSRLKSRCKTTGCPKTISLAVQNSCNLSTATTTATTSTATTTATTSRLTTLKITSNPTVSPQATTSLSDLSTLKKSTPNPKISPLAPASAALDLHMLLTFISVVLVAVLLLVALFFVIRYRRSPGKVLEHPLEDLQINEQQRQFRTHSIQEALAFCIHNIWDGATMMPCQSPILPEDPLTRALLPEPQCRAPPRQDGQADCWPATVLYAIIKVVPLRRWKEFLRLLSVEDRQLERVEIEVSHSMGLMEKQYQMLTLWSHGPSAALNDVYSALHYMDLTGCAQELQESLENMHWETNGRRHPNVGQNRAALPPL